jgi:hypothetical protein
MTFPHYIQKAVDLGLLQASGDKITGCKKEEVETIMGMARIIEKIQPTTTAKEDDTTDQEAIVLCRVLSSPSGLARELWADLRIAFGIGHGQNIPETMWSTNVFKAIGREIDLTFTGERDGSLISREVLIRKYAELNEGSRIVGTLEFNQTISELSDTKTMAAYGDANSEWNVALDLLRQARVRAVYEETQHAATQAERTKGKLEKQIEFQQQRLMECLGMLHGSIGNQGNAVDAVEDLFADDNASILNRIINARGQQEPVSTGIMAMDIDMEGGVRRPGQDAGGRLFTLAARCLAKDTPVIMADGSVRAVQDVEVGEQVLGPDGTPRLVTAASSGQEEMFRVNPVKGDSYVVNKSHILSLRLTHDGTDWKKEINGVKYDQGDVVNMTVSDYLSLSAKKKHLLKGWRSGAVDFHGVDNSEQVLPPYLMGVWLGDGSRHNPLFTLSDKEVEQSLLSWAQPFKVSVKEQSGCRDYRIAGSPLSSYLKKNRFVEQGKFIPVEYKRASQKDRLQLLAGIIDTDGYVSNNCFDLVFKDQQLAEDVVFVARSLGLAAYTKPCQKGIKSIDFVGTYHRITISGDTHKIPTKVARKQCAPRKQRKNVLNTGIKVESVGMGDYYGFTLSGPDHLFLLGDFTVTHNTGVGKTQLAVHAFVRLACQGLIVGFVSAELDKDAIYARIWASATSAVNSNTDWVSVGAIESPGSTRERDAMCITQAAAKIQEKGGKMLVETPWGADVDAVINSLRSMKAKNPEMRAAFIDHFHCLGRHKGAPTSDASMMEERAYKLMTCAKELQIDLIVLAQMNRVGMDALSSKQAPGLDQIRGTDALSHVSHAVWIVRREPQRNEEEEGRAFDKDRPLEFWHSKTRGRQAYWSDGMKGVRGYIECSKLTMAHSYSSVKTDDTKNQPGIR